MKINFYSGNRIEPWSYRNVFEKGIGGSETSHVEMATRLSRRGHDVWSYTDLPKDEPIDPEFMGVHWRDLSEANLDEDGLWIIYRQPSIGAKITPTENRRYWLICQDVFYPDWKSEDVAKFERVIGLCPRHIEDIKYRDPTNADRVFMSSNGVNVGRIERTELFGKQERNPKRLIWASSPDRGLKETLDIFERAREQVDDLELQIFYGMDNIDKICGGDRNKHPWRESWKQYDRANGMEGVKWVGRVGQEQLTQKWLSSGIWLYPTWFSETSCISCMEAQCCGCVPITNPIWATGHNVRHGVFIEGQPNDPLVKARYVDALVRIASDTNAQESMRQEMMPQARLWFDWERFVGQWEAWAMNNEWKEKTQNLQKLREAVCS